MAQIGQKFQKFNTQPRGYGGGAWSFKYCSALIFGGDNPPPSTVGNTESWDGSSWTEVNDLANS